MFTMGPPMWAGGDADPFAANVTALLHFNGPDGSTTFTDELGNSWARLSSPYDTSVISTARSKWGGSSLSNAGGTGILQCSSPGPGLSLTGQFTVECWVYMVSSPAPTNVLVYFYDGASNDLYMMIDASSAYINFGPDSDFPVTPGVSLLGRWVHVFIGFNGTHKIVGCDGVSAFTTTGSSVGAITSVFLGGVNDEEFFMDDLRVTKGVCRYPASTTYAVPTAEFHNP